MVDILNIKWDGKYAVADLTEDGAKEVAYTVKVDCEAEKVIENSNGEMNSYILKLEKHYVRITELVRDQRNCVYCGTKIE